MSRAARWSLVLAVTAGVYATLPVGPGAWRAFQAVTGMWSDYAAGIAMLFIALLVVRGQSLQVRRLRIGGWMAIGTALVVWGVGLTSSNMTPAEKTHFLTYGLLAWVVLWALDLETSSRWRYVAAALIVGALGWIDEGIQYVLPRRHFEWKDVWLNLASGAAILLVIAALRGEFRRPEDTV